MTRQRELLSKQVLKLFRSFYSRSRSRFEERISFKPSAPVAKWTPSEARHEFRTNPELEGSLTARFCIGYLQANLAILPSSLADEFEQFCELNKAPCSLLYRSKRGELSAGILARESDVRYVRVPHPAFPRMQGLGTSIPKPCLLGGGETPGR